jgi:hypothetical protein
MVMPDINAEQAFNSIDEIGLSEPSKLSNPEMEELGFDFFIFSGTQTYLLENKPTGLKAIAEQLTKLSAKEVKELLTEIHKTQV